MTLIGPRCRTTSRAHYALGVGQIRAESTVALGEDGTVDGSRRSGVERHPRFLGIDCDVLQQRIVQIDGNSCQSVVRSTPHYRVPAADLQESIVPIEVEPLLVPAGGAVDTKFPVHYSERATRELRRLLWHRRSIR